MIQVIEDRLKSWLPNTNFKVDGIPYDELSARKLAQAAPHSFQQWAVGRIGGQSRGVGADGGIDGEVIFMTGANEYARGIISVKGGRHVHVNQVRELKDVVTSQGAAMGVFVCLEPTSVMRAEANDSGIAELPGGKRTKIQIITPADLIKGPNLGIPTRLNTVTAGQHARAAQRRQRVRTPTAEELRREPPLPPMTIKGGASAAKSQTQLSLDEPLLTQPQPKSRKRS